MRATVLLKTNGESLGRNYHRSVTAAILSKIRAVDEELASWLHDEGCRYEKCVFKPFIHSRLQDLKWENGRFYLKKYTYFQVGWRDDVVNAFAEGALREKEWNIDGVEMRTVDVEIEATPEFEGTSVFKCISPVVVSERRDDAPCVYYMKASEEGFYDRLIKNLARKYAAFYGGKPDPYFEASLKIDFPYGLKKVTVKWGDYWIVGNYGYVRMTGDPELVAFVYDVGLGRMNSCGFGMLEYVGRV